MEKIVDFAPERLRAPFFLRCAALFIDYMILLAMPLGWLIWALILSDAGTNFSIGYFLWLLGIGLWLINCIFLPLFRGQTVGKMIMGLTILNLDGTNIDFLGILRRNCLGYLITALTLGIGFLTSAVNVSGRSLHDFIAGTVVIRGRKRQL